MPKDTYQDVDASTTNAFQQKKQSAPVANKKVSRTVREYGYSHVKSKLAPAARQRRLRGSKKNAMPSRTMYVVEPSQSADDGEEDEETFDGEDAPVFDEDPELNAQVRAIQRAWRPGGHA